MRSQRKKVLKTFERMSKFQAEKQLSTSSKAFSTVLSECLIVGPHRFPSHVDGGTEAFFTLKSENVLGYL